MPDRVFALRALALYLPIAFAVVAWHLRRPSHRAATGVLLAGAWNFVTLLAANVIALHAEWWAFDVTGSRLAGVPVDLLLGWTALWGIALPLAAPRMHVAALGVIAVAVDLVVMPLCAPVVQLGESWILGEIVMVAIALVPGVLLARWTAEDRHLAARAMLQLVCFASLLLGVLPATIFAHAGGSWTVLTADAPRAIALQLQLAAIPALLGVSALQEFVERGRGTPLPFDAPRRLVTTGPYAYVANPMQLSAALLLVAWGALLESAWVALGGIMTWIYGVGLARMDEGADLEGRFGAEWSRYRARVRNWLPRWRPAHPAARLYVAAACGPCSEIGRWFAASGAVALEIVPAELHPTRDLRRVTYELVDDASVQEEGVAALARAVEHIHLGWAMLAFLVRLPLVRPGLQLLADVSGGEERLVRRSEPDQACGAGLNIPARWTSNGTMPRRHWLSTD
jgi:protein-S-isoprenylcysteine O-methyltransferase Ste14